MTFKELHKNTEKLLISRFVSPFIEVASVAAGIITESGNVYYGVCFESACGLGMCAERSAIANMLTNGEYKIKKLVCIGKRGNLMIPCGSCRELMMQLSIDSGEIEILTELETEKTIKLKELIPNWWGEEKMKAGIKINK